MATAALLLNIMYMFLLSEVFKFNACRNVEKSRKTIMQSACSGKQTKNELFTEFFCLDYLKMD